MGWGWAFGFLITIILLLIGFGIAWALIECVPSPPFPKWAKLGLRIAVLLLALLVVLGLTFGWIPWPHTRWGRAL